MNTTLTAAWFTPEQAVAFASDDGIAILFEERDEQAIYNQFPAQQYGNKGWIASAITDEEDADDVLRDHGLRRTRPWTTQNGYNTATVETL